MAARECNLTGEMKPDHVPMLGGNFGKIARIGALDSRELDPVRRGDHREEWPPIMADGFETHSTTGVTEIAGEGGTIVERPEFAGPKLKAEFFREATQCCRTVRLALVDVPPGKRPLSASGPRSLAARRDSTNAMSGRIVCLDQKIADGCRTSARGAECVRAKGARTPRKALRYSSGWYPRNGLTMHA